ncbi:hypothetical protein RGQ29_031980 [Quercus rubra]|uniref:phosphoglycerate mutase (2,3-diphosphoglycerate-dependent) n=1 Tax=Quercus rubra TaxID=3512 RepID=A0AAN7HRE2_QUERU|nr:hypothetical protein RGQ29_031980 [Quercus rubra]
MPAPIPHSSPQPEVPPPILDTSPQPEVPSPTPPSQHNFDLSIDQNLTPPIFLETPSYPPTSSTTPTPGLYIQHHYPPTASSSDPLGPPVGIDTPQPHTDVPDEHSPHQPSPPQGRPQRTRRAPTCGTVETALILIRHGESLWNEKNLFTGCVDVPLTKRGVEEAVEAGKRISNIPVDMIFTSALIRAQMTAMLAMSQHRRKKVPIVMHNESKEAKAWNQIYSKETKKQSIPVITAWQLNERMYGELQGLNKQETAERYGKEQVHEWRLSFDIPPPNGESLEMCSQRAVAYFREHRLSSKSNRHHTIGKHLPSHFDIPTRMSKVQSTVKF